MKAREKTYPPGERISVTWRSTAELKEWIDTQAEASGRSISQQIEMMLQRAADADRDFYGSATFAFGRSYSGILILLSLIMSDAQGNTIEEEGFTHPEAGAVIASAIARTMSILLDVEIAVPRPPGISRETWELRLDMALGPLYQIRDLLTGVESKPARLLDQLVIDRLTDTQKQRIAAMSNETRW